MNPFNESLNKSPQLGFCLMYPAPGIIERVGPDWDWIWVDGQHGQLEYCDILAAVRACNLIRRPAVVRVPGHEAGTIGKVLDTAADALMVPMVDTVEQARTIVQAAKFPPLGSRSYGGRRPIDLFGRNYAHADQPQPLLICQIETEEGLKNSAKIAAVKGVDAIFFGPDDTALRKGLPMDQPRPTGYFDKALKTVARAAADHGKIAGGVFTTPEALNQAAEIGFRLIVACGDVGLLAGGSKSAAKSLRTVLTESKPQKKENSGKIKSIY
jgi:4-hydroxy-2-oxoheptanedioate aldolase